jgi:hypothetical protein
MIENYKGESGRGALFSVKIVKKEGEEGGTKI